MDIPEDDAPYLVICAHGKTWRSHDLAEWEQLPSQVPAECECDPLKLWHGVTL